MAKEWKNRIVDAGEVDPASLVPKTGSKCKRSLSRSAFSKDRRKPDGLRRSCRECQRAYQKRSRAERPDAHREYQQRYRETHPEIMRELNRRHMTSERRLEYKRRYREGNRDRIRAFDRANKAARRAGAPESSFTVKTWNVLANLCGGCLGCGARGKVEIDHIIPIATGGEHSIDNVQPLCRSCNACKGVSTRDYRPAAIHVLAESLA